MKKNVVTLLLFMASYAISFAQNAQTIEVNFTGIKSNKGKLLVALYNTETSFLKKPFKTAIVPIENLKSIVTFKNIPVGEYAISAFHDENDNKKMDTYFFKVPKEPIGISNNVKGFYGTPKYKDAKFTLIKNENKTLTITIYSIF